MSLKERMIDDVNSAQKHQPIGYMWSTYLVLEGTMISPAHHIHIFILIKWVSTWVCWKVLIQGHTTRIYVERFPRCLCFPHVIVLQLYSSMDFGRRWQLVHERITPNRFYW